ncbi:aminotransferase class I/II-fold pyridoxal phosphate-dependent enzyme [Acetobacterium fimetarium]|uniref:alanine transaminase n=1 Tax=Acetobacterium fimetarium TaxID=52691 RepID=A0ABR6WSG9_9FIRM|nr:pyridoxal phosphate-dependent aminotransferase [Acetobacterium fimetarium]MBC3803569.1 aminotransferase class I/II-fold pyridoxal phosphate-dependent enzyme [Acetobacterium fimetarium]
MKAVKKSRKLDNVCYDIRGPVVEAADRMQREGIDIIMLNTGNTAPFNLMAPDEIVYDMKYNIKDAEGYSNSQGIFSARKAIVQHYQTKGIMDLTVDDVFLGNGASELILFCMQALLDDGDEILVPCPDYPLWSAAVNLAGGTAVYYTCDEESKWYPDLEDMRSKITPNTKGIVVINPNNPTGALYPKEILEGIVKMAVENDLIIFADEVYDKILYDGAVHTPMATLTDEVLVVTLNSLSKSHRIPGFRVGWMIITGNRENAGDYIEGIKMLANMRLCSNVPGQHVIQTALGGYQSLNDLLKPGGRLFEQRRIVYERVNAIPGLSCTKPEAGFYTFPKIDKEMFNIKSDTQFAVDFLKEERVLMVQGTGFNWPNQDHFRIVFLPHPGDLTETMDRLERFMSTYRQK